MEKAQPIHGWMEALYRDKDGGQTGNSFNCVELELTESDIEQFEAHVTDKALPETEGSFSVEILMRNMRNTTRTRIWNLSRKHTKHLKVVRRFTTTLGGN